MKLFDIFLLTSLVLNCTIATQRARGFARNHGGWVETPPQHYAPHPNQLEYGGVPPAYPGGSNEGDIEQVSANNDDTQQQSNFDDDDIPLPPRYVQSTTSRPASGQPRTTAPEATTPKGTFMGRREEVDGKGVYAFYGVPYAKPPVGDLRFRRPVPLEPIQETVDATKLPNSCPQSILDVFNGFAGEKMWSPNTNISEDCLYLNIWVPENVFNEREEKSVPVFFWIYGGGFFSGSNTLDVYNGARFAAAQNLIVVNVQYRLGPLGFLYLGPSQGNYGLFDQSVGLQWTHENIEYFGGNPYSITIAGESCGAASVGYQLVSQYSKKYIKRGMMTSGLPAQTYSFKTTEEALDNGMKLAKAVGCNQSTTGEILDCLRQVDSQTLVNQQWKHFKHLLHFPFTPVVDGDFVKEHPMLLVQKGKAKRTDLLLGTVENEGSFFVIYHFLDQFSHKNSTPISYDEFVDIMNDAYSDAFTEAEREAIIDQYTNWNNPEDGLENENSVSDAIGDSSFVCPHRKFADDWSNRGLGVYYYHLTHRFASNPWAEWMGTLHGDDIMLLFGLPPPFTATDEEKQMIANFQEMVGNFVRNGQPSKTWERYTREHPVYLDVNATVISQRSTPEMHGPRAKACVFWNKLLPTLVACRQRESQCPNQMQDQSVQRCGQSPAMSEPVVTSTSCKCSVSEGPTSSSPTEESSSGGFGMFPPPARY